ncbi:uncharacterized protein NEMAJ01_0160 [Nematocida major]|uniref:uncharacterized protein n=1 Tax=Nematocida major TaxID=1912982 RepID=UPI0020079864|nr:uncharacterized protein NEMAJ01_0160 [Nematocida major]KAH9385264.1 hypothetical protein NEMAJ01_0160 [Nematocida major]
MPSKKYKSAAASVVMLSLFSIISVLAVMTESSVLREDASLQEFGDFFFLDLEASPVRTENPDILTCDRWVVLFENELKEEAEPSAKSKDTACEEDLLLLSELINTLAQRGDDFSNSCNGFMRKHIYGLFKDALQNERVAVVFRDIECAEYVVVSSSVIEGAADAGEEYFGVTKSFMHQKTPESFIWVNYKYTESPPPEAKSFRESSDNPLQAGSSCIECVWRRPIILQRLPNEEKVCISYESPSQKKAVHITCAHTHYMVDVLIDLLAQHSAWLSEMPRQ